MSARTLIRGGCVLTLGARTPNFDAADVLIDDGVITEVGQGLRARDAEVIDARDTIVMPGFVDTHRHTWTTLLRNMGAASRPPVSTYGPRYTPDDLYAATLLALLSAVETGITTVVDWADIQLDEAAVEATRQAHTDAGVRTVLVLAPPRWHERLPPGAPTTLAAGVPDPDPGSLDQVGREWAAARERGLRIHAHVGRTSHDRGVVAELASRGLLGPDVTLVHCTALGAEDLDAIAAQHAGVSLTPASEMATGLATPPLQDLLDRGIRPGLGVDDELLAPGDAFAQMRATQSLQHATHFERKLAGKGGLPNLLTTREVIRYATIDGARAVGLAAITGSLEPGKRADVVVLRTDRPNIAPVNDPIGAVVWGMDPSNVDWVLVDGRPLVRAGALVADVPRARTLALAAQERVTGGAGRLVETGSGGAA